MTDQLLMATWVCIGRQLYLYRLRIGIGGQTATIYSPPGEEMEERRGPVREVKYVIKNNLRSRPRVALGSVRTYVGGWVATVCGWLPNEPRRTLWSDEEKEDYKK